MKRGFNAWRAFSSLAEVSGGNAVEFLSYDTAQTIDTTENSLGSDPVNYQPELIDRLDENQGSEEGVGFEGSEGENVLCFRAPAEHNQRLTPNAAALLIGFALGNKSTVDNEPAASWYTHTFCPRPKTFAAGVSALDSTTITVDDTDSFPASGTIILESDAVAVTYTGKTATTFTGCGSHRATVDNEAIALKDELVPISLPSFTMLEEVGLASKYQYTGVVINEFTLEVARKQFATINASLAGSGTRTTESTARPALLAETFLKAGSATLAKGGTWDGRSWAGSPTTIDAIVRSLSWNYANNIEDDSAFLFNSGNAKGRAERTRRAQTVSAEIELADATYLDHLIDEDNVTLQLSLSATSNYSVVITWPRLRFQAIPIGGGVDILIQSTEALPLQESDHGSVSVNVVNQQADYIYST